MMGARLLEAFPIVPLTRNLTVVVGILSYDGTLHFGLWADRDACGDLEVLAGGIEDAFAEMMKVATERGQSMTELWERDAWELADGVRAGELKAVDLLDAFLARIERFNDELNAFCFLDVDGARRARGRDRRRGRARRGPGRVGRRADGREGARRGRGLARHARVDALQGPHRRPRPRPKPRGCAPRARCSSGSRRRPSSARSTGRARICTASTRNPWNPERTPGGSSGGSAAAVAVGMMPICTGSDGGGSIRIPSAYCGLFGFKVSFGRVGDAGHFDSGLTSVPGPICRSVRDAARYVDAIAGPTDIDPTSLPKPARSYEDARRCRATRPQRCAGMRAAWSSTLGFAVCDPEVEKLAHEAALALVRRRRHRARRRRLPPPPPGPGVERSSSNIDVVGQPPRAPHAGTLDDVTPVSRAGFEIDRAADPDQLLHAQQRRWELLARDRRRVRRGRPDPHADHRDDRVRGRGPAAARDRGPDASAAWARCRTPRRSTSRACPAVSIPVGHERRRVAGRAAGRRAPPRGRARARVRRDRRSRTAPGPSSPPWRTPRDSNRRDYAGM